MEADRAISSLYFHHQCHFYYFCYFHFFAICVTQTFCITLNTYLVLTNHLRDGSHWCFINVPVWDAMSAQLRRPHVCELKKLKNIFRKCSNWFISISYRLKPIPVLFEFYFIFQKHREMMETAVTALSNLPSLSGDLFYLSICLPVCLSVCLSVFLIIRGSLPHLCHQFSYFRLLRLFFSTQYLSSIFSQLIIVILLNKECFVSEASRFCA